MANENKYSLRWEQEGFHWLGFTDGALWATVKPGYDGWELWTMFDEEALEHDGFMSAEGAKACADRLYEEWERNLDALVSKHIEELELELDDEILLALLADMEDDELTSFLELEAED